MSNLLAGLAMALGGGLKGYLQGKDLQRQQRLEEEERKRRDAMDRRREEMENARMFQDGFVPRGSMSADDQGAMTPGTQDAVMKSIEAALAFGRGPAGMPETASKLGEATETPWMMQQRRYTPVPGTNLDFDITKGQDWQDTLALERQVGQERRQRANAQAQEDRKRFEDAQRERETAGYIQGALGGDPGARAQAMARGVSPSVFAPIPGSEADRNRIRFQTDEDIRKGRALADARGAGMPRLTATAQRELDNTAAFLVEIDRAIQDVERAPEAFSWAMGPARKVLPFGQYYGREMDERGPTNYRNARRGYAASISAERLAKAGVATTTQELENLRPYLTETDVVGPKQALENLQYLRRAALEKLNIKRQSYGLEPIVIGGAEEDEMDRLERGFQASGVVR